MDIPGELDISNERLKSWVMREEGGKKSAQETLYEHAASSGAK